MKEKQAKLPGPDGPIAMECNPARVVIAVAGHVVADTRNDGSDVIQLYMRTKPIIDHHEGGLHNEYLYSDDSSHSVC